MVYFMHKNTIDFNTNLLIFVCHVQLIDKKDNLF